jgi:hypothetical protein
MREADPFRNPVGHALREALPALLDVVLGAAPAGGAAAPLDRLIRIRAVQDFTPAQAIGFLFTLKPLLRERLGFDAALEDRIDRLALEACGQYLQCREEAYAIQKNELLRRTYLLRRLSGQQPDREPGA